MHFIKISSTILLLLALFSSFDTKDASSPLWTEATPLNAVLEALGNEAAPHDLAFTAEQVKKGEQIVKYGRSINPKGKLSPFVSKYYSCTTCHNLEQEDPDLRISDPEARLVYVKEKGLPFLQGSTFKGIVNRESWYNDDYVKKYGDEKIERAHKDLKEAIQLCAIECSQGRPMENWELDAVLAYYWSLEFTLQDLELSPEDYTRLNKQKQDSSQYQELTKWLKSFYLQKSPAHFYNAPHNKTQGYEGLVGDASSGKDLYELSCLHCHKSNGVSHYILDNSPQSFKHLKKMIPKDSHFSLYQIIAYGTYAIPGHKPYMPHYPEERMNQQQIEDLRAYIEHMAK